MTHFEKSLALTGQLLAIREDAKRIYGDTYDTKIKPFKALLRRMMKHYKTDSPVRAILDDKEATGEQPPLLMLAACYEISGKAGVK